MKDGSASATKRNSNNFKDLAVRAREEAKTIEPSGSAAVGVAGSAGQAKRKSHTNASNGDLLK